ncbi:UNKNOWN [Stylonychia lemnae]|uniref:Uncharacterized protein n=1 Tax=Stylonychia lemnae TaxID=5949 RepID=A0A078A226_STYLE|nr:UNKNOWN [Stylonychia lemnae]|eukprot:CDW75867.1 UNKNOWN [Stylonychia lemnae]
MFKIQTEESEDTAKPFNPTALSVFRRKKSQETTSIATDPRDAFQNTQTILNNNLMLSARSNSQMKNDSANMNQLAQIAQNINLGNHQQMTTQTRTSVGDLLKINSQNFLIGSGKMNENVLNSMSKNFPSFQHTTFEISNQNDPRMLSNQSIQVYESNRFSNNLKRGAGISFNANETAKFKLRNASQSNSNSPNRVIYYIGDGAPLINKDTNQIFDSSTQGFPYMRKKHMHKASDIQQNIDEPEDGIKGNDEDNDRGTYTEEEYIGLKPKERTLLLTVMEEKVLHMQDKVRILKQKLKQSNEEKEDYEISLKRVINTNHNLHDNLTKLVEKLQVIQNSDEQQKMHNLLRDNEQIVIKCIKYQLDCLSFFKDIVTINRDSDSKNLKMKLDKYISTEGQKLNNNIFKQDYLENKLVEIQRLLEEYNSKFDSSLLNLDQDVKSSQVQIQLEHSESQQIFQIYNSQTDGIKAFDTKMNQKLRGNISQLESEVKLLNGKIKEQSRIITLQNQTLDKKISNALKDLDTTKVLLSKIQKNNVELKAQVKQSHFQVGQKSQTQSSVKSTGNLSDQTSLLISKLRKGFIQIRDEVKLNIKNLRNTIKNHNPGQSNELVRSINDYNNVKGKIQVLIEGFTSDLGVKFQLDIEDLRQNMNSIDEKIKKLNLDFDKRYHSSAKKIKRTEKEKVELQQTLGNLQDELSILRSATTDQSIQKTFQQISIILLQGFQNDQDNILTDQQKELIRTLFGNQVSGVMQDFSRKLSDLEKYNRQLQDGDLQTKIQLRVQLTQSLKYIDDLIDLIQNFYSDNSSEIIQQYQVQKEKLLEQVKLVQIQIQNQEQKDLLGDDVAMNEFDRKLSMIDENSFFVDQSVELNKNQSVRRSGSQGGGNVRTRQYRDRIADLENKIEMLQLENLQLQKDLKKQVSVLRYQNSILEQDLANEFKIANQRLMKSKSDEKFQALIKLNNRKTQYSNQNIDKISPQILDRGMKSLLEQDKSQLQQFNQRNQQKLSINPIEVKQDSYFEQTLHFTPQMNRDSVIYDISDQGKDQKLSRILASSQRKGQKYDENPLLAPQVEEVINQYEEQNKMLQNFIYSQALYIEENLMMVKPISEKFSMMQNSNENQSNMSINSNTFMRNIGAEKRISRLGKTSADTSKSKSVTRYQIIEEDRFLNGDINI